MYSKNYRYRKHTFRYNYEDGVVEWINTVPELIIEFGEVIDSVGLRKENWENIEARREYLGIWLDDIKEEIAYELHFENFFQS